MKLHVVHVVWSNHDEDSAPKETVGCLVAALEKELLLAATYDGECDHFPVCFTIANEDVLELRTLCLIET